MTPREHRQIDVLRVFVPTGRYKHSEHIVSGEVTLCCQAVAFHEAITHPRFGKQMPPGGHVEDDGSRSTSIAVRYRYTTLTQ